MSIGTVSLRFKAGCPLGGWFGEGQLSDWNNRFPYVLVPGGPVDTAFLPPDTPLPRDALIKPDIMRVPIVWLASAAADGITGRRFVARLWDASLPPDEAARRAGAPVAWEGYGAKAARPDPAG